MTEHDESTGEHQLLEAAPTPLWLATHDGRLVNLAYCTDVQVEPKAHGFPGRAWRIVGRPGGRHTTTLADFDTEQTARDVLARLAADIGAIRLQG
jgi:hypothetical protein